MMWSPDCKYLLTFDSSKIYERLEVDPAVNLWDAETGQLAYRLTDRGIIAARFSPDGKSVITANNTKDIAFWKLADGEKVPFEHECPNQLTSLTMPILDAIKIGQSLPYERQRSLGKPLLERYETFTPPGYKELDRPYHLRILQYAVNYSSGANVVIVLTNIDNKSNVVIAKEAVGVE